MQTSTSLIDLLRSAQLGPVRLGHSTSEVEEMLGPPDDQARPLGFLRWRYGTDLELHFDRGKQLALISIELDAGRAPDGGAVLDGAVGLSGGMTVEEIVAILSEAGIEHKAAPVPGDPETVLVETSSGARMFVIDNPSDADQPTGLYVVNIMQSK